MPAEDKLTLLLRHSLPTWVASLAPTCAPPNTPTTSQSISYAYARLAATVATELLEVQRAIGCSLTAAHVVSEGRVAPHHVDSAAATCHTCAEALDVVLPPLLHVLRACGAEERAIAAEAVAAWVARLRA